MIISRQLRVALQQVLGARLYTDCCVVNGVTFNYRALSMDVNERGSRVTLTRAVTLGLFAFAAKKREASILLHDWATGATTTVRVSGRDVDRAHELKVFLNYEQAWHAMSHG
jgi:hypothetical protein